MLFKAYDFNIETSLCLYIPNKPFLLVSTHHLPLISKLEPHLLLMYFLTKARIYFDYRSFYIILYREKEY